MGDALACASHGAARGSRHDVPRTHGASKAVNRATTQELSGSRRNRSGGGGGHQTSFGVHEVINAHLPPHLLCGYRVSKPNWVPLGYGQRVAQRSDKQSTKGENGFERDRLDSAERAGQAVGEFGSRVGRGIAAAAARVREEVEDIWAEAQRVRRGERD
jgi:hypothetical protein